METFTYKEIEVTVKEMTIGDDLYAQIIDQKLRANVPDDEYGIWRTFGDLCATVEASKGLPFDPTNLHKEPVQAVEQAYQWFLKQPKPLKNRWLKAYAIENPAEDPND